MLEAQLALQGSALIIAIGQSAAQLASFRARRKGKQAREAERELLRLETQLFYELLFCQEIFDELTVFQSYFRMARLRLKDAQTQTDVDYIADELLRTFEILEGNIGPLVRRRRQDMRALETEDLGNRHLADALLQVAAHYQKLLDASERFLLNFHDALRHVSIDRDNVMEFLWDTHEGMRNIADCDRSTARSLIRVGSLIADLVRGTS
jgi:hypothetical protein